MKKIFIQLLFLILSHSFSFAEIVCINTQTQLQIPKPTVFPILDKRLDVMCTWETENQSIRYQSSALNGYNNVESSFTTAVEILSLEDSKSIDDNLLGDDFDRNYIKNIPYVIKEVEENGNIIELFEIKRNNSGEALIYIVNSNEPRITFSCLDQSIDYEKDGLNHIKEILLSKTCQEAIQEFNIPLSQKNIKNLVVTKGYLN